MNEYVVFKMNDMNPSPIKKRSAVIYGHKTSITMEPQFWEALKDIAERSGRTVNEQLEFVDLQRNHHNLSSAVRTYILEWYQKQIEERIGS